MSFDAIPLTSIAFILSGFFLAVFSVNRSHEYERAPNIITRQYWLASLYVSSALFVYGFPSLFTHDLQALSIWSSIAVVLNAIGFSHFFLIPLNGWLKPPAYTIVKHGLFLFVSFLAICLIAVPPQTMIESGIIHWRFSSLVGIAAAVHMDLAFALNITLLVMHFYRLKRLSALNAVMLIVTFSLTGLGGTYQYIGDLHSLLVVANVFLCLGISAVFFTVVHGSIGRFLNWQYERRS